MICKDTIKRITRLTVTVTALSLAAVVFTACSNEDNNQSVAETVVTTPDPALTEAVTKACMVERPE